MFHQPAPSADLGLAPARFPWRLGRSQWLPSRWRLACGQGLNQEWGVGMGVGVGKRYC